MLGTMERPLSSQEEIRRKEANNTAICITSTCGRAPDMAQTDTLPVYDLTPYLQGQAVEELAADMARCLRDTSCLVVRDSRVDVEDNETFLNLMESYFEQPTEVKLADARPKFHYQVGVTPEGTEVPRCTVDPACAASIREQPLEHRATVPNGPDPKWRYFWRIGERPADTQFAELNAEPVVPAGFPEWTNVMNSWGMKMLAALHTTLELIALGFGLPRDTFTSLMTKGPHLLGPTGIDLDRHLDSTQSFAGFHYDLNLMTIHGKSRFPGLYIWLADGRRVPVRIPSGCLLLQAGKQLEWLTAGCVKAGMHEVVCSKEARAAVERARSKGQSLWRVSSTVFGHVASDRMLQPLDHFAALPTAASYPPIKAGAYVEQELSVIALKGKALGG